MALKTTITTSKYIAIELICQVIGYSSDLGLRCVAFLTHLEHFFSILIMTCCQR